MLKGHIFARAQAEIRTRKASIAEKEAALAANNPPLFQQIQVPPAASQMLIVHLWVHVNHG